ISGRTGRSFLLVLEGYRPAASPIRRQERWPMGSRERLRKPNTLERQSADPYSVDFTQDPIMNVRLPGRILLCADELAAAEDVGHVLEHSDHALRYHPLGLADPTNLA